jgi:hypothetical protein
MLVIILDTARQQLFIKLQVWLSMPHAKMEAVGDCFWNMARTDISELMDLHSSSSRTANDLHLGGIITV